MFFNLGIHGWSWRTNHVWFEYTTHHLTVVCGMKAFFRIHYIPTTPEGVVGICVGLSWLVLTDQPRCIHTYGPDGPYVCVLTYDWSWRTSHMCIHTPPLRGGVWYITRSWRTWWYVVRPFSLHHHLCKVVVVIYIFGPDGPNMYDARPIFSVFSILMFDQISRKMTKHARNAV